MEPSCCDPELARIDVPQMSIVARDARALCDDLGMKWTEALRLHRDGFLSFDPTHAKSLDESQEAELAFLGSLVAAGCSRPLLRKLLRKLNRPYCYDIRRVFYDWASAKWQLLPGEDDPEGSFFSLLNRLDARNERQVLRDIRDWLEEALDLARERAGIFSHEAFGSGHRF